MKSNVIRIALACAGFLAMVSPALADHDKRVKEETTTTTTTSQGTVSQIGPDTLSVQTPGSPNAVIYQTRTTTYVDEDGNPVAVETVKSGAPVVVYYDKSDAGKMNATRVIVKKKTVTRDED